jgi:hypothetical protein
MIRKSTVVIVIAAFAVLTGLAGLTSARGADSVDKRIPANLMPPAGSVLLFELQAQGVQKYTCTVDPSNASAYVWTFNGPQADLFNRRGEVVGTHFGGPTWQGKDGSSVVAAVVDRAASPDKESIPWLLLGANSHSGTGAFSTITYIQRLFTVGGVAPATGCDADHTGVQVQVPYAAIYAFYY